MTMVGSTCKEDTGVDQLDDAQALPPPSRRATAGDSDEEAHVNLVTCVRTRRKRRRYASSAEHLAPMPGAMPPVSITWLRPAFAQRGSKV